MNYHDYYQQLQDDCYDAIIFSEQTSLVLHQPYGFVEVLAGMSHTSERDTVFALWTTFGEMNDYLQSFYRARIYIPENTELREANNGNDYLPTREITHVKTRCTSRFDFPLCKVGKIVFRGKTLSVFRDFSTPIWTLDV